MANICVLCPYQVNLDDKTTFKDIFNDFSSRSFQKLSNFIANIMKVPSENLHFKVSLRLCYFKAIHFYIKLQI